MALYPTHAISVCSGYGGIDLGLRLALGGACRTILYCEREAYPAAILAGQMENGFLDPAPVWSDLATLPTGEIIDRLGVDPADVVLHGGIPCQPWSSAGERRGADDERWLWPAVWNVVRECGLGWLFLENVRGFVSGSPSGLDLVLRDLSRAGWDAEWDLFSAAECGAPHERTRFFLLAHSCQGRCGQEQRTNDLRQGGPASHGGGRHVGDAERAVWRQDVAAGDGTAWSVRLLEDGRKRQMDLQNQVLNWPMPAAGYSTAEAPPETAVMRGNTLYRESGTQITKTLQWAVLSHGQAAPGRSSTRGSRRESWSTPRAHDTNGGRDLPCRGKESLKTQLRQGGGRKLNPFWVELLMGLPAGWTIPSRGCGREEFRRWETASCRLLRDLRT